MDVFQAISLSFGFCVANTFINIFGGWNADQTQRALLRTECFKLASAEIAAICMAAIIF